MPSKTSEVSRLKDTEKRISGLKDKAEEMDRSVKENVKAKNIQARYFQKIWDTIKRPNLHIILIEEVEEVQVNEREIFLTKSKEKISLNLKKEIPIKVQGAYKTLSKKARERILHNT